MLRREDRVRLDRLPQGYRERRTRIYEDVSTGLDGVLRRHSGMWPKHGTAGCWNWVHRIVRIFVRWFVRRRWRRSQEAIAVQCVGVATAVQIVGGILVLASGHSCSSRHSLVPITKIGTGGKDSRASQQMLVKPWHTWCQTLHPKILQFASVSGGYRSSMRPTVRLLNALRRRFAGQREFEFVRSRSAGWGGTDRTSLPSSAASVLFRLDRRLSPSICPILIALAVRSPIIKKTNIACSTVVGFNHR